MRISARFCAFITAFMLIVTGTTITIAATDNAVSNADTQVVEEQADSWRYSNGKKITATKQDSSSKALQASGNSGELLGASSITGRGIDVSEWQYTIDWYQVKAAGIDFAILRVGLGDYKDNGAMHEDAYFRRNVSECERLGIKYGVYFYSYASSVEEAQREAAQALSSLSGHCPTYAVYYDLEDSVVAATGQANINNMAVAFCEAIQSAGYRAGIYANLYWFNNYLTSSSLDKYEKWVAQWNDECQYTKSYAMWQYSSEGSVAGISGNVDMDYDYYDRSYERYSGDTRYETALAIANKYAEKKGVSEFDNVVIATGENYPDALSGSYLASEKDAPLLLYSSDFESKLINYLEGRATQDGTIYILGDNEVVPDSFEYKLTSAGYNVSRLAGSDRYYTNLEILNKLESYDGLLVCTGNNYADCVSVSSVNYPIIIVDEALSDEQKQFLSENTDKKVYIIGSNAAVSDSVAEEINQYVGTKRICGDDRYETAYEVATSTDLYPSAGDTAFVTVGTNYPDGLAGGVLAKEYGAPLLLVSTNNYSNARQYIINNDIDNITVLGGEPSVSHGLVLALKAR